MNGENAKVIAVESEYAWVETIQNSTCTTCSAKSACGQRLLNSVFKGKRHYVKVSIMHLDEAVYVSDEVELTVDDNVILLGALWVYGLPLIFMLAGALMGSQYIYVPSPDLPAIAGTLLGSIIAFVIVAIHGRSLRNNPKFMPQLSRIVRRGLVITEPIIIEAL